MEITTHFKPGSEGLLAPLMPWLGDPDVSEILINRPQEVFIEKKGQMQRMEMPVLTVMHLKRLFAFIANENGQVLNEAKPLLSGNLYDGARVQLVIPPAAKHYTLSIRRNTYVNVTLEDYQKTDFFAHAKGFCWHTERLEENEIEEQSLIKFYREKQWSSFLLEAIKQRKNIVISGGTSSGKTTFLNACLQHIPLHERLITLEDTYELLFPHQNAVRLIAPKKTTFEDKGICMQDLVQCSLRLRPDRLLVGEIRGKEVLDFIGACSTGHEGSFTTIHANNPKIAFMRMMQFYKLNNVPFMQDEAIMAELHAVIDIVIQLRQGSQGRGISYVYYKEAQSHD